MTMYEFTSVLYSCISMWCMIGFHCYPRNVMLLVAASNLLTINPKDGNVPFVGSQDASIIKFSARLSRSEQFSFIKEYSSTPYLRIAQALKWPPVHKV